MQASNANRDMSFPYLVRNGLAQEGRPDRVWWSASEGSKIEAWLTLFVSVVMKLTHNRQKIETRAMLHAL